MIQYFRGKMIFFLFLLIEKDGRLVKKIISFILIIVLVLLLNGCNTKIIQYHVGYEGYGAFGFDELNKTYLITKCVKSKQELMDLCEQYSNGFYDKDSKIYNDAVPNIIRSYEDSFFNINDLIIIVVDKNDSFDYRINEISVNNSSIVVNLRRHYNHGTFTDIARSYLFLIELSKKEQEEIVLNINDK